jgi:hypothetical protein
MKRALLLLAALGGCGPIGSAEPPAVRVAVFSSDATPPLGHPLCGGWIKPAEAVDQPLLLKGILLEAGPTRCVVAALDWCVLRGEAYDALRSAIARGAGVPPASVAVQCTHTHSAPIGDARAERLIAATSAPLRHLDLSWLAKVADDAARAVAQARGRLRPVTHVGTGKGRVDRFASNRRVPGPDGKIRVRYSATKDAALREAPEGLVDPWLRTVTLFDGPKPLVRLHAYATHPQSFYGDGRVHPDTQGWAREELERDEGVPQIYFTGCGGNVTAGKYNDGSPADRAALIRELRAGMDRAVADTARTPVGEVSWNSVEVRLPPRTEPAHSEASRRKMMEDPKAAPTARLTSACSLAWIERLKERATIDVSRLRIGPVDFLHLPGEPFVEYQLHAQSLRPDRFVVVAGYGEGGPGYLCTDAALLEGGYEPTASEMGPPGESVLKETIAGLLR